MKIILSTLFLYIFSYQAHAAVAGCNCVVFRLDDIQDYWLSNNQQILINTFRNLSVPLTIGIIANEFGEDTALVKTINASLYDPRFELEIADHGYNHEDFTTFTYAQQLNLLQEALAKIKQYLPVVKKINTFIPPYNAWNNNTVTALAQVNITYMSSQLELDSPPYPFSGTSLYRFPEGAQTDLEDTNLVYSVGMPANYTFAQVKSQIDTYGFAVIMMHPMEFSNHGKGQYADTAALNQTQYNALLELIQLVNSTYTITTIENIPNVAAAVASTTGGSTTMGTTTSPVSTTTTTGLEATTTSTGMATTTSTATTSESFVTTISASSTISTTTSSTTSGSTTAGVGTTTSDPPATTSTTGSVSTTGSTTSSHPSVTTTSPASTTGDVTASTTIVSTTGGVKTSTTPSTTSNLDPPATTGQIETTSNTPVSTTGANSEPANATETSDNVLSNSHKLGITIVSVVLQALFVLV